ncbi:hypothetical protein LCGC14_0546510 [marine sediment metagenome]|uniref:Uncharacterized protein n=1 Tax=marine sediment metagenome TaxID=412755 RepID=A0A0F9UCJ5_9ZZZZ
MNKIYLMCKSCIGTTIEGTDIITPCLRLSNGYKFPDNCPKRARGLKIKRNPEWRRIPERIANIFANINEIIGTRLRFFEE